MTCLNGVAKNQRRLEKELKEVQLKEKWKDRKEEMKYIHTAINLKRLRKWLISRGKGHLLDFSETEISKLKQCFDELDADQGGSIGIDELEEPLIGLGIAAT